MSEQKHLYLVDGSSFIFRAYHVLPPLTNSEGIPTGAVYGFANMLWKLIDELNDTDGPTHLAVIFDASSHTFRNEMYDQYKANRPDPPEDLVPQFPLVRDATRAFSVPCIEEEGIEADDIIACYTHAARKEGWKVTIVSSDKDLMQLVDDGQVDMLDTMKNKRIGPAEVEEKFGVPPAKVGEILALMGDSVDNIPGVKGVGVKTAARLITEYGDTETLIARADEIKQPKLRENIQNSTEEIRISRKLVDLYCDWNLTEPLDSLELKDPPKEPLAEFLGKHGFKSMLTKLGVRSSGTPKPATPQTPVNVEQVPFKHEDYETVTTVEALTSWVEEARTCGCLGFDTETNDLNCMRAELVGISLATRPGRACYVPLAHVSDEGLLGEAPEQVDCEEALALLKPLLEDPAVQKVGHNIKYDLLVLRNRHGIDVAPIEDTMLMGYVLDCGKHVGGQYGLDPAAKRELGHETIPFKEVAGTGRNQVTFDKVPLDRATEYAAEDADVALRLYQAFKPRLWRDRMTTVYERLERPLVPVLARMEERGIAVDRAALSRLSADYADRMAALETEIHELAGEEFNIGSPKQLGEILFGKMGLPGGRKSSKTGAYSTDQDTLETLAVDDFELPKKVLDWRQLAKLKSTYADALVAAVNPRTNRVHTSFTLAASTTGRLASSDPNLQNIPIRTDEGAKIRETFIAESGNVLLSADYSQIELRLLAHIADIPQLKQAFEGGVDIHAMTASEMFGVPVEGMDPMIRRDAKAINFGIIYGISAFGLARNLGIPRDKAADYINRYFERFPGIREYMNRTKLMAREKGYVETLFGRRTYTPLIKSQRQNERGFAERAAINAPIQGSAADIIRRAMTRIEPALQGEGLEAARMLLQVHDELIFEVPADKAEAAGTVIRKVMEEACAPVLELDVPLVVDVGTGATWAAAH
ncbi:DNA polymerase I [Pacificimonas flava]|uniref:DNA polymerase I n=2 Tax=Pacificimonas TaxID=1960290 RepID=A0A219B1M3_9SPHN|nr:MULTISPECIES: DNA polymerase I [Pacificimonas]MBZ6378140.1 DNA polymerase I [Pacificimonas aurantium]OWV32225.1 DNA polymerase I [Pacificimonas flava]